MSKPGFVSTLIYYIVIVVLVAGLGFVTRKIWLPKLTQLSESVSNRNTTEAPSLAGTTTLGIGSISQITPVPSPTFEPTKLATPAYVSTRLPEPPVGTLPQAGPNDVVSFALGLLFFSATVVYTFKMRNRKLRSQLQNIDIL